jgi:CheY-like chemotaxis protein
VSFNVLLADDSVPAQNMGKKILVDAGYTVLAVNNGLEALRKIAEAAPDVAILDIFMPGYTGLEICKRLRASAATASIPVILTVGKMEPYRPEDGELVHSNAVIVKPFAAAELISAVRSLIGAPHTGATEQPGVGSDGQPATTAAEDPLQEGHLAAEGAVFPSPLAGDQPATAEPLPAPILDEPLFFDTLSAAGRDVATPAPPEPVVYSGEPLLSGAASGGAASLTFDPDAKHTPFSASAVDLLPTESYSDAGQRAAAFTEFDLEAESSSYASTTAPGKSTVDEPSLAALAASGQAGLVLDGEPNASEPTVIAPESLVAAPEIVSGSAGMVELESSGLDVPALDSLLEVREAQVAPSILESSDLEVGEAPGQLFPDFTAENIAPTETLPISAAAPLSPEEEARKAAFEVLFNSDEAPPLEEIPDSLSSSALGVLPSISDSSNDYVCDIKPDAELEVLGDESKQHFVDPGLDPNLVEEGLSADPLVSTIGAIPDRDPLLDDALTPTVWQTTGSEQKAEETNASISNAINLPQLDEGPGLMPASAPEAVPAEALPEVHMETATPVEGHPSEIAQTAAEGAPELTQIPAEVVPAKAQTAEPEPAHSDAEMHMAEAAMASLAAGAAALQAKPTAVPTAIVPERVEAAPAPVQAAPEKEPEILEAAPVEATALQPEQHVAESPSSAGVPARSNEAERVHQAVERVFERFKPLLIAAIVRELARRD